MKQVGIGSMVLGGVIALLIVFVIISSIPDLKRYIKIETM